MPRKTPPVANQVVHPALGSNALLKARLIDFDTGSAQLEGQHKSWLTTSLIRAAGNSMYRIRLIGYASKLGSSESNSSLSYARITTTLKFLQSVHDQAMSRVETFRANGEDAYIAPESDDSPEWRSVEVHIFIGDLPSPPSPNIKPVKPPITELPGGTRFTQWEIASPGGAFVAEVVGAGFNVFFIRNTKLAETRGYIQPVGGVGASLSLSGLKMAWSAVQRLVTGLSYSNPDFTAVTSALPVTWEDMENCLVRVSQGGAGVIKGFSLAVITFTAAGVWQRSPQGNPVRKEGGDLFQFQTFGANWQLGAGASVALGPLIRVGT